MNPSRQWIFPVANTAFRGALAMFADLEVKNRERLHVDGPVIYVSNHLSNLDPPIVASLLPRRALFLAKRELFNNPLSTSFLKGWGAYPVSRYSADLAALRWMRAMLAQNRAIVMFPEGTRSRNLEGLIKAHIGTALLAAQTGATLVPLGIYGTDNLQNILKVFMPIAKIRVSVGEPFNVRSDISRRAALERATDEIMTASDAGVTDTWPWPIATEIVSPGYQRSPVVLCFHSELGTRLSCSFGRSMPVGPTIPSFSAYS